jgi:mannose-6-phosphate isomerase-like protein (cupin superfamily)
MNVEWWTKWLYENYPLLDRIARVGEKTLPDCELIAEIEPGLAIAVIDRSRPHFHLHSSETYTVLEGKLGLSVGGKVVVLEAEGTTRGGSFVIPPLMVHSAVTMSGRGPAVVEVRSDPPWDRLDHFEVY